MLGSVYSGELSVCNWRIIAKTVAKVVLFALFFRFLCRVYNPAHPKAAVIAIIAQQQETYQTIV